MDYYAAVEAVTCTWLAPPVYEEVVVVDCRDRATRRVGGAWEVGDRHPWGTWAFRPCGAGDGVADSRCARVVAGRRQRGTGVVRVRGH